MTNLSRAFLRLLLLPLLAGCASDAVIEDQSHPLGREEVIVLTNIAVSEAGTVRSGFRRTTVRKGDNPLALKVGKGTKFWFLLYTPEFPGSLDFFGWPPLVFGPGMEGMTYVGDIVLDVRLSQNRFLGDRRVVDNEERTMRLLKEKYPVLFEKYPYKKVLARVGEK